MIEDKKKLELARAAQADFMDDLRSSNKKEIDSPVICVEGEWYDLRVISDEEKIYLRSYFSDNLSAIKEDL